MSWGRPFILWALLFIPFVGWLLLWAQRQRQQALAELGDVALLVVGKQNGRLRQSGLWLLALTCLIVALARPQWGQQTQPQPNKPLQIIFVLDVSHSMLATDLPPDRFTQARNMILTVLPLLSHDEVGLVLFAGESNLYVPLTADHSLFLSQLARIIPNNISPQGTALAESIETAVTAFNPLEYSQKVILLLSDGEGNQQSPARAVQTAVANNIIIYTIGFGSGEGSPVPDTETLGGLKIDSQGEVVVSSLNEATLQQIAAKGGGRYFTPEYDAEMIINVIASSQSQPLSSRPMERYQLFLFIVLVIFLLDKL